MRIILALVLLPLVSIADYSGPLPPNPEPGKCYARVIIPAKYKNIKEKQIIEEERVITKTRPAKYGWVDERVVVEEARVERISIPAKYKNIKKRVLVRAAGHRWKKGLNPVQKPKHATGEILCYEKTDPVYKTVSEKVLVSSASFREKKVPAKYKTIRVKRELTPEKEYSVTVPAKYKTITRREVVASKKEEWKPVICASKATKSLAKKSRKSFKNRTM